MRRGQDRNADLEAKGIIQKSDGSYVKAIVGADGQVRYVPVPDSELMKQPAVDRSKHVPSVLRRDEVSRSITRLSISSFLG